MASANKENNMILLTLIAAAVTTYALWLMQERNIEHPEWVPALVPALAKSEEAKAAHKR